MRREKVHLRKFIVYLVLGSLAFQSLGIRPAFAGEVRHYCQEPGLAEMIDLIENKMAEAKENQINSDILAKSYENSEVELVGEISDKAITNFIIWIGVVVAVTRAAPYFKNLYLRLLGKGKQLELPMEIPGAGLKLPTISTSSSAAKELMSHVWTEGKRAAGIVGYISLYLGIPSLVTGYQYQSMNKPATDNFDAAWEREINKISNLELNGTDNPNLGKAENKIRFAKDNLKTIDDVATTKSHEFSDAYEKMNSNIPVISDYLNQDQLHILRLRKTNADNLTKFYTAVSSRMSNYKNALVELCTPPEVASDSLVRKSIEPTGSSEKTSKASRLAVVSPK